MEAEEGSIDRNPSGIGQATDVGQGDVKEAVRLAFAPVHKRAFGVAVGSVCGLGVFALTAFHVLLRPAPALEISLLAQYFHGYSVTWPGAFVGLFWGFVTGFVGGWFAAFCRNLGLAALVFVGRTRAELEATRNFLDHI